MMRNNTYQLYILECADGKFYTGITTDLERRVAEHNGRQNLGAKYTAARRPVKAVYAEEVVGRSAAARAEARIKKLTRAQKMELIEKAKIKI